MIADLSALRMALDEWKAAEGDQRARKNAARRVASLATPALLVTLVAAIDDPDRPGPDHGHDHDGGDEDGNGSYGTPGDEPPAAYTGA